MKASSAKNIPTPPADPQNPSEPDPDGLSRYAEAADDILMIVSRSSSHHVHYVNPFLASTIWLAAAAQLVYKFFRPPGVNMDLTESKFEVLRLNYMQFVEHWKTSTTLQDNLEILRKSLDFIHARKTSPQAYYSRFESGNGNQIAAVANMTNSEVEANGQPLSSDEGNSLWMQTDILDIAVDPGSSAQHNSQMQKAQRPYVDQFTAFGNVDENFEDFIIQTGLTTEMDLDMAYDINSFLQAQLYRD